MQLTPQPRHLWGQRRGLTGCERCVEEVEPGFPRGSGGQLLHEARAFLAECVVEGDHPAGVGLDVAEEGAAPAGVSSTWTPSWWPATPVMLGESWLPTTKARSRWGSGPTSPLCTSIASPNARMSATPQRATSRRKNPVAGPLLVPDVLTYRPGRGRPTAAALVDALLGEPAGEDEPGRHQPSFAPTAAARATRCWNGTMLETPEELDRLQALLDASMARAGPHLRDIISAERRLDAPAALGTAAGLVPARARHGHR